jgi:hypothetical protein
MSTIAPEPITPLEPITKDILVGYELQAAGAATLEPIRSFHRSQITQVNLIKMIALA